MIIDVGKVYTKEEVAEYLRTSEKTIDRRCREGKLKFARVGIQFRFKGEWVHEFLDTPDFHKIPDRSKKRKLKIEESE